MKQRGMRTRIRAHVAGAQTRVHHLLPVSCQSQCSRLLDVCSVSLRVLDTPAILDDFFTNSAFDPQVEVEMKSRILTALLLGSLFVPSVWPGDWVWEHPAPQGNTLRAAAQGEDLLIAVGDCGTIVRYLIKTKTWEHVPSLTQMHLRAIALVSAATWVAAGTEGTILRSADAGSSWALVKSDTQENLYGLAFGRRYLGIAVGSGLPSSSLRMEANPGCDAGQRRNPRCELSHF